MSEQVSILVLDDEPIVGKRLKPSLVKLGCDVEVFENPKEALKRIAEKEFDIVVTDIHMDEVDGFQIMEQVQRKSSRTKIIIITGYAMMEVARKAMEKGAFDFIAKPFTPGDLRDMIASAAKSLGVELTASYAD